MQFKFYVINYDSNIKGTKSFNIFDNIIVNNTVEKEVKKYISHPGDYEYYSYNTNTYYYGFNALCQKIDSIISCEESGRYGYEFIAGYKFSYDTDSFNYWDCYLQAHANIEAITRECIYQYKQYKKEVKNSNE